MFNIAFATCEGPYNEFGEIQEFLLPALTKEDLTYSFVPFNSKDADWKKYRAILLVVCWDYHFHITEFMQWLDELERLSIKVLNPISVAKWNLNKKYLLDLQKKGFEVVPTKIFSQGSSHKLVSLFEEQGTDSIVIKPTIGAGSHETYKIGRGEAITMQSTLDRVLNETDIMVQPYMSQIQGGELSIFFIGGEYSHTVLKKPGANDFRANNDQTKKERIDPNEKIIDEAKKIVNSIESSLLYARVDGVIVEDNFVLMELEVIEPSLYLHYYPEAAEHFASELKKLL